MGVRKQRKYVTVAPFQCTWQNELKFKEPGRGCVTFEASAHNDVTIVFREEVGTPYYHYRTDNSPNYTVVLGSHRNRRLKIEMNGKTVVDVAGIGLCCSSGFQSYWISIYDGLINIGRGNYPLRNIVYQWKDSEPNCKVQYVGLSSWGKHVGYRNINMLPFVQTYNSLVKTVDYNNIKEVEYEDMEDMEGVMESYEWGLENFLESWDLADMYFVLGEEERVVPAHKIVLDASGNFPFSSMDENVIRLHSVSYPVLHALLQYVYTGQAQIMGSELQALRNLSIQFKVVPLTEQCEKLFDKFNSRSSDKMVEIVHDNSLNLHCIPYLSELVINVDKLKQFQLIGKYSDVDIYIDGHGFIAKSHKLILSLWSVPFTKMFTNGMCESNSSEIWLKDVSPESFSSMLRFMYSGEIEQRDKSEMEDFLLSLLLLADRFGVSLLQQECYKRLVQSLSEDSVCHILHAVSGIPSCSVLEGICEKNFALHFDYCTTTTMDFVLLDESTFKHILEHPDLTVTSEERVLDAILLWCIKATDIFGWEAVDERLEFSLPEHLFGDRLHSLDILLLFVRFPIMPLTSLSKLKKSHLSRKLPIFDQLVREAIIYSKNEVDICEHNEKERFTHRRSGFKELQYICDGDKNGVIYFAGTSYGEHQWVNPVLAKKIVVSASSPSSRYTDPKALVSRTFQATSFAGPLIENGNFYAWWMVDIGQEHQLMCNYYTLRQDGSIAYPRWWKLQGSVNGLEWTDLRVHENDQTICKPGQFASWPIHGRTALLPFRFFRVLLTGSTTADSDHWNLCLCFLELYGYFH